MCQFNEDFDKNVRASLLLLGFTGVVADDEIEVMNQAGISVDDAVEYIISKSPQWFDD